MKVMDLRLRCGMNEMMYELKCFRDRQSGKWGVKRSGRVIFKAEMDEMVRISRSCPYIITKKDGEQGVFDVNTVQYLLPMQICSIQAEGDEIQITALDSEKSIKII